MCPYDQITTLFEQCKANFISIGEEQVTAAMLMISQRDVQLQHHELAGSINPDTIEFQLVMAANRIYSVLDDAAAKIDEKIAAFEFVDAVVALQDVKVTVNEYDLTAPEVLDRVRREPKESLALDELIAARTNAAQPSGAEFDASPQTVRYGIAGEYISKLLVQKASIDEENAAEHQRRLRISQNLQQIGRVDIVRPIGW